MYSQEKHVCPPIVSFGAIICHNPIFGLSQFHLLLNYCRIPGLRIFKRQKIFFFSQNLLSISSSDSGFSTKKRYLRFKKNIKKQKFFSNQFSPHFLLLGCCCHQDLDEKIAFDEWKLS